jgi:hypothetical protein
VQLISCLLMLHCFDARTMVSVLKAESKVSQIRKPWRMNCPISDFDIHKLKFLVGNISVASRINRWVAVAMKPLGFNAHVKEPSHSSRFNFVHGIELYALSLTCRESKGPPDRNLRASVFIGVHCFCF